MTSNGVNTAHAALVDEVAQAVEGVGGVAFLKPGVADRLRSKLPLPARYSGRARPAGVRITRPADGGPWHIEIQVVVLRRARPVDVARAVRARVEDHVRSVAPAHLAPRVTVTVTGRF